jgi:predicted nucleic acid-binding protein
MRTTVELKDEHRAKLLELAARRGKKGLSDLLAGARTPKQQQIVGQLLDALPTLSLDRAGADRAAQVRRALENRGDAIGMGDSLIAGIVLQNGGTLLTRNRRHFERVEGLRIVGLESS